VRVLLSVPPFSNLPLHVRFFNEVTQDAFHACRSTLEMVVNKQGIPLRPVPEAVTSILDLGGVLGTTGQRESHTPGVTALNGPIDVKDMALRENVWQRWTAMRSSVCSICDNVIDTEVCP
jgi:structure-specific endonuclease subunit SLX1